MKPLLCPALTLLFLAASCWCAEKVTLHMAGGQELRCEVLQVTKSEVKVKTDGDKEQSLPLLVLQPKDVLECYRRVLEPKNAALRFDMGAYFAKKELFDDARAELLAAVGLDVSYKDKADEILKKMPGAKPVVDKTEPKKTEPKKPDDKTASTEKSVKPPKPPADDGDMIVISPGDTAESIMAKLSDFRKNFKRKVVPARTEAQMKEFVDKRLADLNAKVGGSKWRLIETKHYYCFSNLPEQKHGYIAKTWDEGLYDILCRVLNHKEGDKLWNNKLPIYYFETFKQFQKFARDIDKSPGAAYSGGYFSAEGREVHICIPFMSEHLKGKPEAMDEMARSTLFHEGTHAFLQLSGEDVELSRWLHEGMAQFIEFWSQGEENKDKKERMNNLREYIQAYKVAPTWEEMQERPMSGRDVIGYCCAYAKLEFLYRHFPHESLPKMVKLIKSGKTEKEAMETVFGHSLEKMEDVYNVWLKDALKKNFNFNN
jgi:hypothetical protein